MSLIARIKPKHLELVSKIAESQQLQLAAQMVGMSQPAASRILADLETSIGSPLFTRHPTGMELTPAGHVFVNHARVMLSELTTMDDELSRLTSGASGNVRVGAVTGPAVGYLMPALQSVLHDNPDLHVSVDVAPSVTLFRQLEESRYDFILGRIPPGHDTLDLRLYPARTEIVSLMVHQSHPLASQEDIELETLVDFPWVMQSEGNPIREAVTHAFHSRSLAPPQRIMNSSSLLVALTRISDGLTVSPQTEEVKNLLVSEKIGARLTTIRTRAQIVVAPYFVIHNKRRKLPRAAEKVLEQVLARI